MSRRGIAGVLLVAASAAAEEVPRDDAFRLVRTEEGVSVKVAPSEGRAPWGCAEGRIDAPAERVVAHLTDFDHMAGVIPKLKTARVIERGDGEAIVYFYFDLPWPIANRDYTARYRWGRDGERTVVTVEEANARGPAPTDAVRVTGLRGRWEIAARDGATLARYCALIDFGGSLTRGMVEETAWKQPLRTVLGVRKALRAP